MNWFVEAGVLGLIAITVLTVISLVLAVRAAAAGTPLGAATLVSVVGFLVLCLADHPAAVDRVEIAWWVVLGVAAAVNVPKSLGGSARPDYQRNHQRTSAGLGGAPEPSAQLAGFGPMIMMPDASAEDARLAGLAASARSRETS